MKHISKKRLAILLVSVVALLAVAVGVTLAYVATDTDPITNTFKPSEVACAVVEEINDPATTTTVEGGTVNDVEIKSNVRIQNTGDTDAYIRAAVVINWKDAAGNVYATAPDEGDYTVVWGDDWVPHTDGYYYYTKSVAPGAETPVLIKSLTPTDEGTADKHLSVEIVASAVQANGVSSDDQKPVFEAWGVDPTTPGTN